MMRFHYPRLTIRQRLTFLICLLLLTTIFVFGLISYLGVKKAAIKVGEERLKSLTEQLSSLLAVNARTFVSSAFVAVNRPAIKSYLQSGGKDSSTETRMILEELRRDTSYVQVELKNHKGSNLLRLVKEGVEIKFNIDSLIQHNPNSKPDSGKVGKLYAMDGVVYYPIVSSVIDNNLLLGQVVRWRRMTATAKSVEQLSQLLGTEAKLLIGNFDGSVWTDMRQPVEAPPFPIQKRAVTEYRDKKKNLVLANARPIANSQWVVAIELSKSKILDAANRFLFWLVVAGLAILAVGIFIAWLVSRKISDPLRKLTHAATELAAGNHASVVQVSRVDELGKLARAFNAMATKVRKSQEELEKRAQNYKLLFENNPMPMWIISKTDLTIIDVNNAAISHYGYSREEFLKLKSTALRPEEDIEKYLEFIRTELPGRNHRGIWRHKKKDGTVIMVDVIADDMTYQDKRARLVLANDITEKLKAEAELVRHRIMQQEIITETTIQVQEQEREELGKELHDNINQILVSTKLYLEIAQSGKDEFIPEAISKSYENVNLAIGEIRQLSKQLVAPSLDSNLVEVIRDLTKEIQAITPITIFFTTENFNEQLLNNNLRLMLYRIVQEQINNILKHAAASEIKINIETREGMAHLLIEDNGIGFDTRKKAKGIGLRNIDNRVKFYDGISRIISQEGKGTRLEISVPLERQSKPIV